VFGHLVLTRSVIEACSVSHRLNDPAITPDRRQRRELRELIYSAEQGKHLKMEDPGVAAQRVADWNQVATDLGWAVTRERGRPVVDSENRPSVPAALDGFLTKTGSAELGRAMWGYLSGVDHGTWFALGQSFVTEPTQTGLGPSVAMVGTESRSVYIAAFLMLRCLRSAADTLVTYKGWGDEAWAASSKIVAEHERVLLHRIVAMAPPTA
jgi:hypothetical protein